MCIIVCAVSLGQVNRPAKISELSPVHACKCPKNSAPLSALRAARNDAIDRLKGLWKLVKLASSSFINALQTCCHFHFVSFRLSLLPFFVLTPHCLRQVLHFMPA